ncbi:hypothetical protein FOVG_04017 [Fusarium oxysporum f. sp. pisi HDV247]|uniref:Zn(2)-C6 fungal-type domain-containing protein n=1 Tax=Fusarium oxysporum f. sp. pisi HDV247 TaxID=1080344 RepID=W9PN71_FUSOX|nr:hypothetical protein FOVG_04017 [Fusarium oxysporum f. sp. pisi HDV247]
MVYNGPSKGCRRCRDRRIKCDQRQPECLNCSTRGSTCPGYRDIFDKAHRDETAKVWRRHSRHSRKTVTLGAPPTLNFGPMQIYPPRSILSDPESNALNFFFLHYSLCQNIEETCSFFSLLPDMYAKSDVSSPLNRATAALALQVAHLHFSRGGESRMASTVYAYAVVQTKQALAAPAQSKSDSLLMTTLILEAYESAKGIFGREEKLSSQSHMHVLGSIALLKHRGPLNFKDELSWRLVIATRNRLLHHTSHGADELAAVDAIVDIWGHGNVKRPKGPSVEADTLAFRLSQLRLMVTAENSLNLQTIIDLATDIASQCAIWHSALSSRWRPISIPTYTLAPSIQFASTYEQVAPTVYANISIANSVNRQRTTELGCLSLIGSCLVNIPHQEDGHQTGLPSTLMARAQILVDEICASVPFLTGDVTAGELWSHAVFVPSVVREPSYGSGRGCPVPENTTKHAQQVITSGLYMMYGTLTAVLRILGNMRTVLRDGQVRWIIGQVDRLRHVLHIT